MINVLLISYYWPPAGGGGVHRWLKMSKYLVREDINLTVYTPENPEYPAYDETGLNEIDSSITIVKTPIAEPYKLYKIFTGKKKKEKIYSGFINKKESIPQKISTWIRGNLFIPDARFLWIKPSFKFLKKYLVENNIDVVISTGPPHSMHMIALKLKEQNPSIKWIADFRDPWTNIDFYDKLKLTKWADRKHHELEKKVIQSADKVVAIGWTMQTELEEIRGKKDVELITNGYDHTDFNNEVSLNQKYTISHLGSMNGDRNPIVLWKAISELKEENIINDSNFQVHLVGQVDQSIIASISENSINNLVQIKPFVQHKVAINIMQESQALLLVINNSPNAKGILTGKGFEYLGSKRPILCIGPEEGDMQKLFSQYSHVEYIEYENIIACKNAVLKILNSSEEAFEINSLKYSRLNLAKEYANLIKKLVA